MNTGVKDIKWYLRPVWVIVGLLVAGPFAFGLLWKSPAFKKEYKIAITVAILFVTFWMLKASADLVNLAVKYMQDLKSIQ